MRFGFERAGSRERAKYAFAIAPLWVPLLLTIFWTVEWFRAPGLKTPAAFTIFLGIFLSYGGTFLLGWPAFRFLRSRKWTSPWIAVSLGFAIAMATYSGFLFVFGLILGFEVGESVNFVASMIAASWLGEPPASSVLALVIGPTGMLVGITLWLIARPDRD